MAAPKKAEAPKTNQTPTRPETPKWGIITKVIVILISLSIIAFLVWRFSDFIGQLIVAAMLAYIVNPTIEWLQARGRFSRGWAVMITYLTLLLVVLGFVTLIGVAFSAQFNALYAGLKSVGKDIGTYLDQMRTSTDTITILGQSFQLARFDWGNVVSQATSSLPTVAPQGLAISGQVISGAGGFFGWVAITLLLSIYIAIDLPRLGASLLGLADQSGYREDVRRLVRSFNRIWDAYLRGQVILGLLIAIITSVMLAALGVQNWLALGLLSGVLQVIPYVGPTLSAILIVIFAFFQDGNYLNLSPGIYALVVGGVTLVVQQVSGNILLPTVVGDALNMSPLAVLISLIIGFAFAGVMGVILAAPAIASLRLLVTYIWRKLLDLPPFPDEEPPPTQVTMIMQRSRALIEQIRNRGETPETHAK